MIGLSAYAKVCTSASTEIYVAMAVFVKLIVHLHRNAYKMQFLVGMGKDKTCAVCELTMQISICKTCDNRPILGYRNTNLKSDAYRAMMLFF